MARQSSLSSLCPQLLLSSVIPGLRFPHLGHGLHYLRCFPLAVATASQHVSKIIENRSNLETFTHPLPVLLVIIVPHIVPLSFVSTALGAHKSVSPPFLREPRTNSGHRLNKRDQRYLKLSRGSSSTYGASRHLTTTNPPLVIS